MSATEHEHDRSSRNADRSDRRRRAGIDVVAALVFALAAGVLYRATWQEFMFDDGPTMAVFVALDLGPWYHVLLVPIAMQVKALFGLSGGLTPLLWVSTLSGAIATAATYGFLRRMDATRASAATATALFATAPALWFQSTTTEVHALHAAVVTLAALLFTLLPWHARGVRFAGSVLAGALLVGALVLAHRAGITAGGGFLALAWVLARRRGSTRSAWVWLFLVGPVFLVGGLVANAWGGTLLGALPGQHGGAAPLAVWKAFGNGSGAARQIAADWLAAWPLVALLALVGLFAPAHRRRDELPIVLAGVLPAVVVFAGIGLPSMGGYALAAAPFVLLAALRGVHGLLRRTPLRSATIVATLLVAVHATLTLFELRDDERVAFGRLGVERANAMRKLLPDGGTLLSVDASKQLVTARVPNVEEPSLRGVLPRQRGPETLFPETIPLLDALVATRSGRIVWDPNWREHDALDSVPARLNYLPLEAYLERNYAIELAHAGGRTYWRISWLTAEPEAER